METDWRLIIGITAAIITAFGYIPYFNDIFARKTTPHIFTWIVWAITQGTATAALIYGGGKFGSLSLVLGTVLVTAICLLCLRYGTKNITRSDTVALIAALIAIVVWWQLDAPLISVLLVTLIDAIGYIPTMRKAYVEPYSETVSFWVVMSVAASLTIISNAEYNFLTVTYLAMLVLFNLIVVGICLSRRRVVEKSQL